MNKDRVQPAPYKTALLVIWSDIYEWCKAKKGEDQPT